MDEELPLLEIKIFSDGGPWAHHNMPCAVCQIKKAVLDMDTGVFHPCWGCRGVYSLKRLNWIDKLKRRWNAND